MLFENPVLLNMHLRMQPRSVTTDKMAGVFANASGNTNDKLFQNGILTVGITWNLNQNN